jgi:hypothetical protein
LADGADHFPFHTTESEKRIIRELLQIAAIRKNADGFTVAQTEDTAAAYIARLKTNLFPHETAIAAERIRLLKPLQTDFMRAHFDPTLETAAVTFNAKIRTSEEYRLFVEKLNTFDFEAWLKHCEAERADAD